MRNEKYFCINCFENENIKGFIKDNGNLVQDKTFKCGFCQVSDWKHNEMYDIKDYDKKLFNSMRYILFLKMFSIKRLLQLSTSILNMLNLQDMMNKVNSLI